MYRLSPSDFRSWFQEIHGVPPFPWQQRVFDQCLCPPNPGEAH